MILENRVELAFVCFYVFLLGFSTGFLLGYMKAIKRAVEGNQWIAKMMEMQRLRILEQLKKNRD